MVIFLPSTSDKVQIITSAATNIDVHVSYSDLPNNSTVVTPGRTNTAITTATTTDVVASPAASTTRALKMLVCRNKSTTSNTLTVRHTDGSTIVELFKGPLYNGEELIFYEGVGFRIYDSMGQMVTAAVAVRPSTNDFRVTGVSATPVMTADSTSLSTIYLSPFKGQTIALFDGTNWQLVVSGEVSLAVTGRTTDLPFDVFAFLNAGVVTLEFLDWTSSSARATTLTRQDGVWTKTGDATRRWVASCRPRSATTFHWVTHGTDAPCKLDLFNADNRVEIGWFLDVSTASWNYTIATIRQAQASTNYQVDIMCGIQEEYWVGTLKVISTNSTISINRSIGWGFDSTTTFSGTQGSGANTVASINIEGVAQYINQPAIGRHAYSWNEESVATGTCTFIGRSSTSGAHVQSGGVGSWPC